MPGCTFGHQKGILKLIQGLMSMLNENGHISKQIEEVFDESYLTHQMENKVFDLYKIAHYTVEKMLQLCAPVRDAEIRSIAKEDKISIALIKILDILELMKLDLANYRLQSIKPHLMQQAAEYEAKKFSEALENGKVGLRMTEQWLSESYQKMKEVSDSRNPEQIERPDLKLKFHQILNNALLSLLFSNTAVDTNTIPETLKLDQERIFGFQNELQALTIVAALTTLSRNVLPVFRGEDGALKAMVKTLLNLLSKPDTTVETLSDAIVEMANELYHKKGKFMAQLSTLTSAPSAQKLREVSEEEKSLVKAMVDKTLSLKDPFFNVLYRRIEKVVRLSLENGFKSSPLASNGLGLIEPELEAIVEKISILSKHNKKGYAVHYDKILSNLI
jgi:hypothetical protein